MRPLAGDEGGNAEWDRPMPLRGAMLKIDSAAYDAKERMFARVRSGLFHWIEKGPLYPRKWTFGPEMLPRSATVSKRFQPPGIRERPRLI